MNRLFNLLLKMPLDVLVGSMNVMLTSLRQVNDEWKTVSDEVFLETPRTEESLSESSIFTTPAASTELKDDEMLMNSLIDEKFGTQDLGNDRDRVTLIDVTVSYIKYDEEIVLHHGRQILKPEIRAGQVEREINDVHQDQIEDSLKKNKLPKDADTEDISIEWFIVKEIHRDKPEFEKDRNDALTDGTVQIVDAINKLGDRWEKNSGKAK